MHGLGFSYRRGRRGAEDAEKIHLTCASIIPDPTEYLFQRAGIKMFSLCALCAFAAKALC
jgi:hypothetical protein